jgi:hypothetical protein
MFGQLKVKLQAELQMTEAEVTAILGEEGAVITEEVKSFSLKMLAPSVSADPIRECKNPHLTCRFLKAETFSKTIFTRMRCANLAPKLASR